jgi:hypothetical protein
MTCHGKRIQRREFTIAWQAFPQGVALAQTESPAPPMVAAKCLRLG